MSNMDSIFRALQKGRDEWNKMANIMLGRKRCMSNCRGINEGSPGAGTNRDAAPGASANWRGVIVPQPVPERTGILFKISGAAEGTGRDGQRLQRVAGTNVICDFTVS